MATQTQTTTPAATSSVPTTLAALESFFQGQIQSASQVAITEANVGITGLTTLLNQTIGGSLVITSPVLTLASTTLTLAGNLTFLSTSFSVSLAFTEANGSFSLAFTGTQAANTAISLTSLVAQILPAATNAPAISLSGVQISFGTSPATFSVTGTASWQITVGTQTPAIQVTLSVTQNSAALAGSLAIGTATFTISYTLQSGGQILSGTWADPTNPLTWNSVVTDLGLTAPALPSGAPNPAFHSAAMTIDFSTDNFTLTGQTANGAASFEAMKQNGAWGFAIGLALGANWTFGELSSDLSPLDFLVFEDAFLLISSFTQKGYTLPSVGTATTFATVDVTPGLNVGGVINFAGGTTPLAKSVYAIVGASTASLQGSIGTAANTRITASLGGSMIIPPARNLILSNPEFVVIASPLTAEIQGTLQVTLNSTQVVDITGRVQVSEDGADFAVDVTGTALAAPFGFTGVTLLEIGAEIGLILPASLTVGLEATFQLGTTPADKCALIFAVGPDEVNPVLLWAQFSSISFPTFFTPLFPGVQLPAALGKVSLQNVYIYYCDEAAALPDGTGVSPGFAVHGTLNVCSFTMTAALQIAFNAGVSGSAAMSPIQLGHVLSITGNTPGGGPAVAFSTISSPYLNITLDVQLMGVFGASINGTITDSGFSFLLGFTIPAVSLNTSLACTYTSGSNFSASAALQFNLNFLIGPLTAPKTNIKLGTIHVNTSFTGSLSLGITSTQAKVKVTGTFDGRTLPEYDFDASTMQLKDLVRNLESYIKTEADTIYADVLSDANKWAGMVKSGAITGADDAARVLTGFYGESVSAATSLLQQYGLHGSTNVHADVNFPHVDTPTLHTDIAATHADTTPHGDVTASHIDTSAIHADVPANHSDFHIAHVDTHGDNSFFHTNFHDDTGGHTDSQLWPHGDSGGHTDKQVTPHGDSSSHADSQITPHGDTPIPHGDTTPHTDSQVHIDV